MKPVIIIPGMGGSILVNRCKTHKRILHKEILDNRWINIEPISPFRLNKWNKDNNIDISICKKTNKVNGYKDYNKDIVPYDLGGIKGITNMVPEFGILSNKHMTDLDKQFNHTYFGTLCNKLIENGYTEYNNLIGIPYDFRLLLDPINRYYTFETIKTIIEQAVLTNEKQAIICAHSLGGILFKSFLGEHVNQQWVDDNIDKFISLNVPYGGIPSSVKTALYGDYFIPYFQETFKEHLKLNSGLVMSLPNHFAYENDTTFLEFESGNENEINIESYHTHDYVTFRLWRDLWQNKLKYLEKEVKLDTYIINSNSNYVGTRFIKHKAIESSEGDGVVPIASLNAYKRLFVPELTKYTCVPNASHVNILNSKELFDTIIQ